MAENETPENETTPEAEETTAATDAAAESEAPEAPEAAAPAAPEPPKDPKERRQVRRAAAVAKRGPRRASTPEDRLEERRRKAAQRRTYRARLKAKKAEQPTEAPAPVEAKPEGTGHKKVRQGVVVSDKADKTITVRIDVTRHHRKYKKTIRSSTTLHAHDERNDAHIGDTVRIVESRPLSRLKRWRLVEVLERAK